MAVLVSLPVPEQVALPTYPDMSMGMDWDMLMGMDNGLAAGNEEEKAPKRGFQKVHPNPCMGPCHTLAVASPALTLRTVLPSHLDVLDGLPYMTAARSSVREEHFDVTTITAISYYVFPCPSKR